MGAGIPAENITGVYTLDGTVRHLLDPDTEQPEAPSSFGATNVTACKRRYFCMYDSQHDRPLCRRCEDWLRKAYDDGTVVR